MSAREKLKESISLLFYILLLMVFGLSLWIVKPGFSDVVSRVLDTLSSMVEVILVVSLILILTKILLIIGQKIFTTTFTKYIKSEMDTLMMWQLFSYLIWVIAVILLFLIFTSNPTGFGVSIGIFSAALVFILQKPLLNIAGWMVIIFKKPYAVGERIEVMNKKGFVVEINLMYTKLREFGQLEGSECAFTGRYFSFPNSFVFEQDFVNYDRDTTYIWDEVKVSVTYESDLELAKKLILEATEEVVGKHMTLVKKFVESKFEFDALKSRIILKPTVRMKLADSSVDFYAIYFTDVAEKGKVRSLITEKILEKFGKEPTVSIAYPHLQIVPHHTSESWQRETRKGTIEKSAVSFYPEKTRQEMKEQQRIVESEPEKKVPSLTLRESKTQEFEGKILLPVSRINAREPLIRFLAEFGATLNYELKVLNVVKMLRRKQRHIDIDSITQAERDFLKIKKDLNNISMEIKIYYDPVQSIISAMIEDEKVKMVVIPWDSSIFPTMRLTELLEKTLSRPKGSCDIVVAKGVPQSEQIKKILVPVGYGPNILKFGKIVREYSFYKGIELVLLGVAVKREERKNTEKRIEDFYNSVVAAGWQKKASGLKISKKVVVNKNIAEAIIQAGKGCDLITLGATGRRDLRTYLFGSIPDIVVKNSKTAVMILQRGER